MQPLSITIPQTNGTYAASPPSSPTGTPPSIHLYLYTHLSSDMDPDRLYPDPDPQYLINPDPDPVRIQVNKITKFSKHSLIFKSLLPKTSAPPFYRFRLEKYYFQKEDFCGLNTAFPFIISVILYLWIRIRNPDPRTQMNPDPDPHHCIYLNILSIFLSIQLSTSLDLSTHLFYIPIYLPSTFIYLSI